MYQLTFGDFIRQVATQVGIPVNWVNPSLVMVSLDLPEKRKQTVYIEPIGMDPENNLVVGFYSPALKLPLNQMLGQKIANELLRANSKIFHGAWAILTLSDGDYLVVADTQIAQFMEPQEFKASTLSLALLADAKELELTGTDVFK
ncbi:hypothetical protein JW964_17735 [candidate division KSB1 bacterium]|nr:hypothetical protein [candidate division KSB1 bacterium]